MLYDCADIQVNITQSGFIIILIIILFILILKEMPPFSEAPKRTVGPGPYACWSQHRRRPWTNACAGASHTPPLRTETAIPLSSRLAQLLGGGEVGVAPRSPASSLRGPLQRTLHAWLSWGARGQPDLPPTRLSSEAPGRSFWGLLWCWVGGGSRPGRPLHVSRAPRSRIAGGL